MSTHFADQKRGNRGEDHAQAGQCHWEVEIVCGHDVFVDQYESAADSHPRHTSYHSQYLEALEDSNM